jgi:hypothetical protein
MWNIRMAAMTTGPASGLHHSEIRSNIPSRLSLVIITPFGRPVVSDVHSCRATSSVRTVSRIGGGLIGKERLEVGAPVVPAHGGDRADGREFRFDLLDLGRKLAADDHDFGLGVVDELGDLRRRQPPVVQPRSRP